MARPRAVRAAPANRAGVPCESWLPWPHRADLGLKDSRAQRCLGPTNPNIAAAKCGCVKSTHAENGERGDQNEQLRTLKQTHTLVPGCPVRTYCQSYLFLSGSPDRQNYFYSYKSQVPPPPERQKSLNTPRSSSFPQPRHYGPSDILIQRMRLWFSARNHLYGKIISGYKWGPGGRHLGILPSSNNTTKH